MSRTFSINSGSFDSLKVSLRCGCSEKARQIRFTVLRLRPEAAARDRVLQCVASFGVVSNVIVSTRSTSASLTLRGVPGRGSAKGIAAARGSARARARRRGKDRGGTRFA